MLGSGFVPAMFCCPCLGIAYACSPIANWPCCPDDAIRIGDPGGLWVVARQKRIYSNGKWLIIESERSFIASDKTSFRFNDQPLTVRMLIPECLMILIFVDIGTWFYSVTENWKKEVTAKKEETVITMDDPVPPGNMKMERGGDFESDTVNLFAAPDSNKDKKM